MSYTRKAKAAASELRGVAPAPDGWADTSGGEKGLRGSGAGTLGVPLGGTPRVGGLLGVAGRLSGTVSPFMRCRGGTKGGLQPQAL